MTFEYWFTFPVAFVFATIAIASGVGGARASGMVEPKGVIIGAQFGSFLSRKMPKHQLDKRLGLPFFFIAALTVGEIVL